MGRVGPRCCDGATHKTHAADARPEPRPCPVRSVLYMKTQNRTKPYGRADARPDAGAGTLPDLARTVPPMGSRKDPNSIRRHVASRVTLCAAGRRASSKKGIQCWTMRWHPSLPSQPSFTGGLGAAAIMDALHSRPSAGRLPLPPSRLAEPSRRSAAPCRPWAPWPPSLPPADESHRPAPLSLRA